METTMPKVTRDSLLTLEAYNKVYKDKRREMVEYKKSRVVHLGEHLTLIFEDEQTIRYQIQEMLRIEKTFDEDGIQAELDVYNPLIPDGSNFKATMMLEYAVEAERKTALARLIGIEDRMFVQVEGQPRVYAIADEDLERENAEKTSSVHFLRFELTAPMRAALKAGAQMQIGCDHTNYPYHLAETPPEVLASLVRDLD